MKTSKAVQSAIVMHLDRALGTDWDNNLVLSETQYWVGQNY